MDLSVPTKSGMIVTPQTIKNILYDANIRKKKMITEINRMKILEFAKTHVSTLLEF